MWCWKIDWENADFIFPRQFSYFVLIYVFLISVYTAYLLESIKVKQINRIPDTICLKKIIFEIFLGKFPCTALAYSLLIQLIDFVELYLYVIRTRKQRKTDKIRGRGWREDSRSGEIRGGKRRYCLRRRGKLVFLMGSV